MLCIHGFDWLTVLLGRNADSRKATMVSMVNARTPPKKMGYDSQIVRAKENIKLSYGGLRQ